MQNDTSHIEDDTDDKIDTPVPWTQILGVLTLLFSYLWIGFLTGSISYSLGMRALMRYAAVDTVLHFLFFTVGVLVVLFWPISQYVVPELRKRGIPFRFFAWILLLCPPLLSYGYYIGELKVMMDIRELLVTVFFPVVIGYLFYEKTEKLWIFSLFVCLSVFMGFYVVNDLLGPFETLFYYSTKGPSFYFWRLLTPILALGLTVLSRNPVSYFKKCAAL